MHHFISESCQVRDEDLVTYGTDTGFVFSRARLQDRKGESERTSGKGDLIYAAMYRDIDRSFLSS